MATYTDENGKAVDLSQYTDENGKPINMGTETISKPAAEKSKKELFGTRSKVAQAIDYLRPIALPAAYGAGFAATEGLTGGFGTPIAPLAGAGTAFAVDQALRYAQGDDAEKSLTTKAFEKLGKKFPTLNIGTPDPITDAIASTAELALGNKVGEVIGSKIISGGQAAYKALRSPTNTALDKLGASVSQRTGGHVSALAENIFAYGTKAHLLENQANLGKQMASGIASNVSGRMTEDLINPNEMTRLVKYGVNNQFTRYLNTSNKLAAQAENIAKVNALPRVVGMQPTAILGPNGQPTMQPITKLVEGPIDLSQTVQWAKNYLANKNTVIAPPDVEKTLMTTAKNILDQGAILDPQTGAITSLKPISFKDAWELKKAVGDLAYSIPGVSKTGSFYKDLTATVNRDMDASIATWPVDGVKANRYWNLAKKVVGQREENFSGDEMVALLKSKDTPTKALQGIINDSEKLQRALVVGSGKGINIRQDLSGVAIQNVFQDSFNEVTGRFDPTKLINTWKDPHMQDSYKLLFNDATKGRIDELVDALAKVSTQTTGAGKTAFDIRVASSGVHLAAGLIAGGLDFFGKTSGIQSAELLGLSFGLSQITKFMLKPEPARIFTAMLQGNPTGFSKAYSTKILLQALSGSTVNLITQDGSKEGTVNKFGQIELK